MAQAGTGRLHTFSRWCLRDAALDDPAEACIFGRESRKSLT
jgi:hypothetical protein